MRIGLNPLRSAKVGYYHPVILAVITHLPNMEGYHEHRLEVIQRCIQSMTEFAGRPFSLAVWDNGSCQSLRNWIPLLKPAVFVQSENVGKASARVALFRMFPPNSIIAMSDDDILYYPGWLDAQMELLETYPNAACVSGNPIRTSFRWGCENTKKWMKKNASLEVGRFIPDQYERDFCISIGRDPVVHKKNTLKDMDYRGQYKGVYAYATSHHCQFISVAGRVLGAMKYDNDAMGDEKPFDIAMDKIGLRLSTVKRYSRHIGNFIHDELRKDIRNLGL
jgi:glycosyltransferase involved in cell wall biosynthesis